MGTKSTRKPLGLRNTNVILGATNRGSQKIGPRKSASATPGSRITFCTSVKSSRSTPIDGGDDDPIEYVHRPSKGSKVRYYGDFDDRDDPRKIVAASCGQTKKRIAKLPARIQKEAIPEIPLENFDASAGPSFAFGGFSDDLEDDLSMPWDF